MIRLTCFARVHTVVKEIQGNYREVDSLISNVKKIFLIALRIKKFKEETPSLPLPSQPVLLHWGMWLDAVIYYCANHSATKKTVRELDSNEVCSIKFLKKLLSYGLSGNLAYIKSNFMVISETIACLEAVGAETNDAPGLVKSAGST
jgi:hypothetical protein